MRAGPTAKNDVIRIRKFKIHEGDPFVVEKQALGKCDNTRKVAVPVEDWRIRKAVKAAPKDPPI